MLHIIRQKKIKEHEKVASLFSSLLLLTKENSYVVPSHYHSPNPPSALAFLGPVLKIRGERSPKGREILGRHDLGL